MSDSGVVKIHNKEYQTVAKRISLFREKHPYYTISTAVLKDEDIVLVKAIIKDEEGRVIANGYAEEIRDSTNINRTSALENCETSAVGRALAFFGYGGSEIASANEVNQAIIAGAKKEVSDFFIEYNKCVRAYYGNILDLKHAISEGDLQQAVGLWYDLPDEIQGMLYKLAPSKGGILETHEREIMKSNEWTAARNEYYKGDNK